MNNFVRYPLFVAITSVVLSAYGCGGSGGGSPSAGMDDSIDPRITQDAEWHTELSEYADAVRMATGGSSPTLSSAGHDDKLREIATNTDTITGLAFWSVAGGNYGQYDPDCSGAVCTHHSMHPEDYVTKENLIDPKEDVVFFPLMRHRGTEINRGNAEGDDTSGAAYGEWESQANNLVLNHVVGSFTYTEYERGQEWLGMTLWGDSTGSNPAVGSASWSGALVGYAFSDEQESGIFGDVEVTVNFGNETVLDAMFANVVASDGSRYTINPWMSVPVSGGSFEEGEPLFFNDDNTSRYISGRFFGPDAEEVGGLFADDGISISGTTTMGVFGAVRDDE